MNDVTNILKKYALIPTKLTLKKGVRIVESNQGRFVFKKNNNSDTLNNTYNYLKSRAFLNFPELLRNDDGYDIYEYLETTSEPNEQKINDLVNILTSLHLKTTFYKEIDLDEYKKIYEDINSDLEYLYNYYTDIITIIEKNIYMSPSEYLIARNISKIFEAIKYCKNSINKWWELVQDKRKVRVVQIHNNLCLDHYIKNDKSYLISWEKSKIDMPIYDLYILYQNHYLDFEFSEILYNYESRYRLLDEERQLLFVLLMIPQKFEFNDTEYNLCKKARIFLDYIFKTMNLISKYRVTSTP